MATDATQPFDIVDLPHIPWQPGLREWLLLGGLFLTITLIVRFRTARHRRRSRAGVIKLLLADIESAAKSGTSRDIERISHLARRIVEYVSGDELSTLSPRELTRLAERSRSLSLQRTLLELASLEELVYEPPSAMHDRTIAETSIRLAATLREYVHEEKRA